MSTTAPLHFPAPSAWVRRFASLIAPAGTILDYACGSGRHARWLARHRFTVEAVDRDVGALATLAGVPGITPRVADLEEGVWPFVGRRFDAVVVTNYLYRPRFGAMLGCLESGGLLIYETFMEGHERFGKPSNPAFLLRRGELLQCLGDEFSIVAFEQGTVQDPRPSVVQRICAIKSRDFGAVLPPACG